MCGRTTLYHDHRDLQLRLGVVNPELFERLEPRYNIAPTERLPVVFRNRRGERQAGLARWGLVPHWAEHPSRWRASSFNARAEGAEEAPTFRTAFRRGRVVVPASGFFEWTRDGAGARRPHYVAAADGGPLLFAGLMDVWRARDGGERLVSASILTTTPNALMRGLHDRMPVLLAPEDLDAWLEPGAPPERLRALLRPAPDDLLRAHPVTPEVNRSGRDDPRFVEPLPEA